MLPTLVSRASAATAVVLGSGLVAAGIDLDISSVCTCSFRYLDGKGDENGRGYHLVLRERADEMKQRVSRMQRLRLRMI